MTITPEQDDVLVDVDALDSDDETILPIVLTLSPNTH